MSKKAEILEWYRDRHDYVPNWEGKQKELSSLLDQYRQEVVGEVPKEGYHGKGTFCIWCGGSGLVKPYGLTVACACREKKEDL